MTRVVKRTSRVWALEEQAICRWRYRSRTWARKGCKAWISWAKRSVLEPMALVAALIESQLKGILNAVALKATNATSESINSRNQRVKRMACGLRTRELYSSATYFHRGGLDLYPVTHT